MPEPGFLAALDIVSKALLEPQEFARHKPAAGQQELRWITIHSHGEGEEGRRIQINTKTGEIEKGFGAGKTMHEAFAPKSEAPAASEAPASQGRKWYGMKHRPPAPGAIPKGQYEHQSHPDFRHGQISYDQPLTDEQQHDFELTPIRDDSEIPELAKQLGSEMGEYADQYADPENDSLLNDRLGQDDMRKILGHVDKEKLKEEFRKQFGKPVASPEPQSSEDDHLDELADIGVEVARGTDGKWTAFRSGTDSQGRQYEERIGRSFDDYGKAVDAAREWGSSSPAAPSAMLPPEIAEKYPSLDDTKAARNKQTQLDNNKGILESQRKVHELANRAEQRFADGEHVGGGRLMEQADEVEKGLDSRKTAALMHENGKFPEFNSHGSNSLHETKPHPNVAPVPPEIDARYPSLTDPTETPRQLADRRIMDDSVKAIFNMAGDANVVHGDLMDTVDGMKPGKDFVVPKKITDRWIAAHATPKPPEDAIAEKYPSLAESGKPAEMNEMVRAAAGYQLHGMRNEPEDRAAWREHSKHMTKSAVDAWLQKKFGIDSATARAVSNAAGEMNPFETTGGGTVGGQGVKWTHNSPEPTMAELGDMPWVKPKPEDSLMSEDRSLSAMTRDQAEQSLKSIKTGKNTTKFYFDTGSPDPTTDSTKYPSRESAMRNWESLTKSQESLPPEIAAKYPSLAEPSAKDDRLTPQGAIRDLKSKISDTESRIPKLEAAIAKESGKEYKPNSGMIAKKDMFGEHAGEQTIGGVNEKRRANKIESLKRQLTEANANIGSYKKQLRNLTQQHGDPDAAPAAPVEVDKDGYPVYSKEEDDDLRDFLLGDGDKKPESSALPPEIAAKYPSLAEQAPDPSKMSLADKLAYQKANPGKGKIKTPEKQKPKQMASVSGAKYEFVKDNGDGTATVRNEQGDEFSTDPGEPWSLDKSTEAPSSPQKSAKEPWQMRRDDFLSAIPKRPDLPWMKSGDGFAGKYTSQVHKESVDGEVRASDGDKANWEHVQKNGGYEAARDSLSADIKSLKSRLAKTKDANKWKLESNLASRERDLERLNALNAKFGSRQFSRRAPHEELVHQLHECMNHDGKCQYEPGEGEDDISGHVPDDPRQMDKSVHELCRHLGATHPELRAAYENYTAAVE